jgi:hypothetical protein
MYWREKILFISLQAAVSPIRRAPFNGALLSIITTRNDL